MSEIARYLIASMAGIAFIALAIAMARAIERYDARRCAPDRQP